ncbi:5-formyltetrahydrofolate cyclo-ligase [Selenomonas ruminis]|uniref:5-formyltetrahydrofolate cyclo-ligase n=1 Tax=Selenomonas ruminis TaxID=2593411 RepID=A0A5D6WCI5_9FIRM|nr:5-formyltetrahydrofolate cyclo-ligase [Selenomonas sp. mPRGC5]TYZ24685.1 5-formyltetrahydrofolate cyclo-ligase [Selenomonas sp. mPRGC5]
MAGQPVKEAKKALRKRVTAARKALMESYRAAASRRMLTVLLGLPAYQRAKTVFLYASMPDEVQLYDLMKQALADGKTVCLPLITGKGTMEAVAFSSLKDLVTGEYGILTVDKSKRKLVSPSDIDLIVVPGAAFDRAGGRLGLGAGFYDRFMTEKAPQGYRCALAFSCQLVETVPMEPHDAAVQYIITEDENFAVNVK